MNSAAANTFRDSGSSFSHFVVEIVGVAIIHRNNIDIYGLTNIRANRRDRAYTDSSRWNTFKIFCLFFSYILRDTLTPRIDTIFEI